MPSVRSVGRAGASATTVTPSFDSGATALAGSLLLAFVSQSSGSATLTPPGDAAIISGPHTPSNNDKRAWVVADVADGGETGMGTFTSDATNRFDVHIVEITGVDAAGVKAGTVDIFGGLGASGIDTALTTAGASLATASPDSASTGDVLHLAHVHVSTGIVSPTADNSFSVASAVPTSGRSFVASRNITNPGATSTTLGWTNNGTAVAQIVAIPQSAVGSASRHMPRGVATGVHRGVAG